MTRYTKNKHIIVILLAVLFLSYNSYAQNQWDENGIKVADATAPLINFQAVSDDSGDVYLTYQDISSAGDYDIFIQKLSPSGICKWSYPDTIITNAVENDKLPSIAIDGSGGVFVAWERIINGDTTWIYIQHINSDGSKSWLEPKRVCNRDTLRQVKIISDNNNGVFVVWKDKGKDEGDIYAQHFTSTGNSWSKEVAVTTASGSQSNYQLICTDSGDLIVVWVDERNGNRDLFTQKISAAGTAEWTSNGMEIVTETSDQYQPCIEKCGTYYIITWTDKRTDSGDIYAQLINDNGNFQWLSEIPICNASYTQDASRIAESCSSSAIITWWDSRSGGGYDVYAQRIDSLGNVSWTIAVNNSSSIQYLPEITSDSAGGAFVVWMDSRSDYYDLYSQHIDKNGQLLWDSNGIPIVTATGYQADQIVVNDQSGGFITLWVDQRNEQNDMYAQLTNDNITVTNPLSGEIWNGTIDQTITWSLNTETVVFDHLSLKASAGGVDYPITDNISPSLLSHTWSSPGINSTDVTLYIQARNKNNDILCSYQSQTFTLDSEPPLVFSLLSPADNETVEKIITFEWEATSDNLTGLSHYELWIDGSLFQDNLQETTYTLTPAQALSTGPHTWTVRAIDNAGVYQESAENSMEVVYDNTPPLAFHLLTPENNTYTSSASPLFSWENTTDPGGLLDSYKFYLDGSLIAEIPPDQTSFSDPVLATTGAHNWYITAVDTANNVTPSSETWTVLLDNAPPDNFSLLTPASNSWINDTTPLFTWEETTDSSGGIGLAEYELWIDDNLIIDNISADNQEVQLPTSQSLSEGVYYWYIKAKDSLENSRNSQADFTLKIDVTQPSSFDLVTPEDNSCINTLNPDFSWTSSEDILSGLEKYQLYINGSLNKDNISALQAKPAAPLTEGSYSWSVTARDSAGNIRNINTFEFTADTTSPEPFQLITPENNTTIYMDKPQFSWQSAVDNLAGIKNYSLLIDGSITADNLSPDQTVFTISQSLDNGTHTWQIIAYDSAGNFRSTAIFQFQVLCNPPVITSASQVQATEDILFSYTAQAEDPDLQEVEITFSQYPSWLSPSQNEISGTPVEGTQDTSFLVIATDGYYYDSLLVEVTVIPVNDPPEITSPENASATEDEMFTYIATAQDPDNEVLEYIFKEYPSWLTPQENYITGTPTEGEQDTTFTVIVSDGELTDTLKVPITITAVNDPPQITSTPSISVLEDELLSYTVTAQDPDNEILIFSYIEKPFWLAVSDQTIEGYARQNYTDTCFTVTVTDGTLSDTLEVSVEIVYVNDSPVILSSNKVTAIEDSLFTYIPQAGDPDNETIIFSFTDYPTWLLPGENKISGTPTEGKQDTCFKVIASDGQLSDTMKVTLTVIPVNDPPVITSSDTASAIEKKSFSYQATAKDVDSENISISFAEYPSWLSVTGNKIKGTPGDNCQDTTFTVIASDTKLSDTLKVTLKIIRINDPPIFVTSLPRDITITNRDTLTCELKNFITDPDNSLDDLTWTHTVLDTNTLTITINQKSQLAKICGEKTHGCIHIIFKVSDPQGASAQDTLQFYINKTTSINDYTIEQIPDRFILQDNYPNPFNNSTTLKYGIPQNVPVTLCIYNMLGQKVAELLKDKKQTAGYHLVKWDSGSLPSGIYFYHLTAGKWVAIKKMILMK